MRIDFGASYKDVARLLKASSSPVDQNGRSAFSQDLASLLPDGVQATVIPSKTAPAAPPNDGVRNRLDDVRASLRYSEPELQMPEVKPLNAIPDPFEIDPLEQSKPLPSVKTPTVLSVKRVELAGDIEPVQLGSYDREGIHGVIRDAGLKNGVDPKLSMAVVKTESAFNPTAVSVDGHESKGLFQLLDSTGRTLLSRAGQTERPYNPFDPVMNADLGTSYLKYLHDVFRSPTQLSNDHMTRAAADSASLEKLAVAAFNAGEGRVASAQQRAERAGKNPALYDDVEPYLPRTTRSYVRNVVASKALY